MKYLILIAFFSMTVFSCASKTASAPTTSSQAVAPEKLIIPAGEDSLIMTFDLKNQPAGVAKLVGMYEDQRFIVDSATIDAQGHFELSRKNLMPQGYYYFIMPGQKALEMLLDKHQRFQFTGDMTNIKQTAQITGSTCLSLFYKNMQEQSVIDAKIQAIAPLMKKPGTPEFKSAKKKYDQYYDEILARTKEYQTKYPNNFFTKFKVAGQNPKPSYPLKADGTVDKAKQVYDYRKAFWKGYDFTEVDLLRTPVFSNKLKKYFTELIPLHQDSIIKYADQLVAHTDGQPAYFRAVVNWVALKYEPAHTNLMDGEAVYSHIIKNYFTTEKAYWSNPDELKSLHDHATEMEQSLLGKTGKNVTAKGMDGKNHSIYELQSPITVVFIYSPDCSHCRQETPKLIQLYKEWHPKGVAIYSIAANTTQKEWVEFHHEFKMPWSDVFDPTNASWYPKYFVDITPEIYVLDKSHKIIAKNIKVNQLPIILKENL